jgi:membrane-associated PAP2 superfamily phosphatase
MSFPDPTDPSMARRDALWTLAFLAFVVAWDASGADLQIVRWFGGPHGFAWRNQWALVNIFHEGGRWLSALVVGVVIVHVARPWAFARDMSLTNRWWWCVATAACLLLIPTLKHASATSCPWDLTEFGGSAHYVSHWALGVPDGGPGGCFPSGHASAAFSFFGGWFVLRETAPKAARRWLAGVLILGSVFGIAQMLRGAHYPSHSMWTAWLCWTASALLWHASSPLRVAAVRPVEAVG